MPSPEIIRVVVEPDNLSAWIGVAGVGIGVVLSFGVQVARDWIKDRKDRQRELTEASDALESACNALGIIAGFRKRDGVRDEPALGWVEASIKEAQRAQKAVYQIERYAPVEVGEAARRLAQAALKMAGSKSPMAELDQLKAAQAAFHDAGVHVGLHKALRTRRGTQDKPEPTAAPPGSSPDAAG